MAADCLQLGCESGILGRGIWDKLRYIHCCKNPEPRNAFECRQLSSTHQKFELEYSSVVTRDKAVECGKCLQKRGVGS